MHEGGLNRVDSKGAKTTNSRISIVGETVGVMENRKRTGLARKETENSVSLQVTQDLAPYSRISKFPQERTLREI